MAESTCAVEDCDRPAKVRGWCYKHYTRWSRHGDPMFAVKRMDMTEEQRIESEIYRAPSGHWIWLGGLNTAGYGLAKWQRRSVLVHRWTFEKYVGPLTPGLTVDHLCRVIRCCAPLHLDQVTQAENTRRGSSPGAIAARTGKCLRGHDLAVDGYVRKDRGGINCRSCRRELRAARRERRDHVLPFPVIGG